jgi:hypothetical protein
MSNCEFFISECELKILCFRIDRGITDVEPQDEKKKITRVTLKNYLGICWQELRNPIKILE